MEGLRSEQVAVLGLESLVVFIVIRSYPAWLATRDLGTLSEAKLMTFAASSECRGGAEIMDKANGLVVIRCGGLMRYEAGTFIAHREDVR